MTVAEIMTPQPITVGVDDTLATLRELFERHRFHHLMVASGRQLLGVISDRDVLRHLSPFLSTLGEQRRDGATLLLRAHQIMTRRPITVGPQTDVVVAARALIEARISCLPVVDEKKQLIGVVTWKDLLKVVVESGTSAKVAAETPRGP